VRKVEELCFRRTGAEECSAKCALGPLPRTLDSASSTHLPRRHSILRYQVPSRQRVSVLFHRSLLHGGDGSFKARRTSCSCLTRDTRVAPPTFSRAPSLHNPLRHHGRSRHTSGHAIFTECLSWTAAPCRTPTVAASRFFEGALHPARSSGSVTAAHHPPPPSPSPPSSQPARPHSLLRNYRQARAPILATNTTALRTLMKPHSRTRAIPCVELAPQAHTPAPRLQSSAQTHTPSRRTEKLHLPTASPP